MYRLQHCVPLDSSCHSGKFVFKVEINELLFMSSLQLFLSNRVCPLKEGTVLAMTLPSLRCPRDIVHCSLELCYYNLILGHHVDRLQVAQLFPIIFLNRCILLQLDLYELL